jgi:hypothetical protein
MWIITKLDLRGVSHPGHCCDREDLLTWADKTPKPLPHPDTGAPLPCENQAEP